MEDLPPPTMKITPEGNYFLIENEAKPPDPISGNFHKLGHFFKVTEGFSFSSMFSVIYPLFVEYIRHGNIDLLL